MAFPLYAPLYSVGGRSYRRNPIANAPLSELDVGGGDTADKYEYDDDYDEDDDGFECKAPHAAAGEAEIADEDEAKTSNEKRDEITPSPPPTKRVEKEERRERKREEPSRREEKTRRNDRDNRKQPNAAPASVGAPPGLAPPPGLVAPPGLPLPPAPESKAIDSRVQFENGKWFANISVPPQFYGLLIGARAASKRQLEEATGCRVKFPPPNSPSDIVEIVSMTGADNVSRCIDRIELIVAGRRRKEVRPTHFVAIPLACDDVVARFLYFQETVVSSSEIHQSCRNVSLFPNVMKLHLTVVMLQLLTEEDKAKAKNALEKGVKLAKNILGGKTLEIKLKGLDIMNDDNANVHVLFAKVAGEKLQEVSDIIRQQFVDAGVAARLSDLEQGVKLHMTVMNSRYAADKDYAQRETFDASSLMKLHGDFDFGNVKFDKINICCLNTESPTTGNYEMLAQGEL